MNAKAILLAVLATGFLLVGAAGAATAQPANDSENGDAGPPSDLPGPVPDFVEDILGSISDFLFGSVSDLGSAVSGIASGR